MDLKHLIEEVERTRKDFIAACSGLTWYQSNFKVAPDVWSITEIAEHIVRAEWGGTNGIWRAIDGCRNDRPVWTGENANEGLSIEEIVERTWMPRQPAPESAVPQWGGPIEYWLFNLGNCSITLAEIHRLMEGLDPAKVIYPHVLSGPLNMYQRMEFLRFHMQRHIRQIDDVKKHLV